MSSVSNVAAYQTAADITALPTLRIGGVPEHFNLPWLLAIESGMFNNKPYKVAWTEYPDGTGAMCKALRNNELDIAIVLTEGIVADIVKGNPAKILQLYVKSPLTWGIHTAAHQPYQSADDLQNKVYAISRKGSGSHLMTYVDANNRNWLVNSEQFVEVGGIQNLVQTLQEGKADAFLWEKYTTKPWVDAKHLKRVGECVTPWSCFVMAATDTVIEQHAKAIEDLMRTIQTSAKMFMLNKYAIDLVGWRYKLGYKDAQNWYHQTEWATNNRVSKYMLNNVLNTLLSVGIIKNTVPIQNLCSTFTKIAE